MILPNQMNWKRSDFKNNFLSMIRIRWTGISKERLCYGRSVELSETVLGDDTVFPFKEKQGYFFLSSF